VSAGGEARPALVLLTAWHLPRARSMPRLFWRIRALDRASKSAPGCLWVHRWASRRSLLLTSHWATDADAERWLASEHVRRFDAAARAAGATARVERLHPIDQTRGVDSKP
jgi:quinol monooxygenase YgiN